MGLQQGIIFLPCTSHAMTPGTPGISFHFPASCPLPLTFRMAPIQASVGRSSKHCRTCDRCVEGFDHHCKWLNNCIGEKNYQTFFALICLTVTLLLVQFGYAVYLFSRSFYDSAAMMGVVQSNYGSEHIDYRGWQAVLVLYLLLLAGAIMMLGELLFFHVVLVTKNMTTYDFIMAQQNAGGAAPPPNASGGSGARAALCRSGRIADESTVPAKRKPKVSLNPCKAMMTERLQGDPRSWGSVATGKPVISGNPGAGSKLGARQPGDFTAMPLPYGQPMQGMRTAPIVLPPRNRSGPRRSSSRRMATEREREYSFRTQRRSTCRQLATNLLLSRQCTPGHRSPTPPCWQHRLHPMGYPMDFRQAAFMCSSKPAAAPTAARLRVFHGPQGGVPFMLVQGPLLMAPCIPEATLLALPVE